MSQFELYSGSYVEPKIETSKAPVNVRKLMDYEDNTMIRDIFTYRKNEVKVECQFQTLLEIFQDQVNEIAHRLEERAARAEREERDKKLSQANSTFSRSNTSVGTKILDANQPLIEASPGKRVSDNDIDPSLSQEGSDKKDSKYRRSESDYFKAPSSWTDNIPGWNKTRNTDIDSATLQARE